MTALMFTMSILVGLVIAAALIARCSPLPLVAASSTRKSGAARTPLPSTLRVQTTSLANGGTRAGNAASLWRLATANPHCPLRRMVGTQILTSSTDSPNELPRCTRMDCDCRYERVRDQRREPRRTIADRREELRLEFDDEDRRRQPDRRIANRTWAAHAAW